MGLFIHRKNNPPSKSKTALGVSNGSMAYAKIAGGLEITGLVWHIEPKADEREGPYSRGISKIPDADIARDSSGIVGLKAHTYENRAAQPYPFFFIAKLIGTLTQEAYVDWQITWNGSQWPANYFDYSKHGRDFTVLWTDDYPSGVGPTDVMFDPEQFTHRQAGTYIRGWNTNLKTGPRPPEVHINDYDVTEPDDWNRNWDKYKYGGPQGPHRSIAELDCDNLQPPQVKAQGRYAFVTFRRFEPWMTVRDHDPDTVPRFWNRNVKQLWPRVWATYDGICESCEGEASLPFTPWSVKDRRIVPEWPRPVHRSLELGDDDGHETVLDEGPMWHTFLPKPISSDYKGGNEALIEPGVLRVTAYVYDSLGGNLVFAKTITLTINNDGVEPWWKDPGTGVNDVLYSCTPNYCESIPPEPADACRNEMAFYNTQTGAENFDDYVPVLDVRDTTQLPIAIYELSGLINTQNAEETEVSQPGFSIARMCDEIPAEKDGAENWLADIWAWHDPVGFSSFQEQPILNCTFAFVDLTTGFSYGTGAVEFITNDGVLDPLVDPPSTTFSLIRPPFADAGDGQDSFPAGALSLATETSPRIYIVEEPASNWQALPINVKIAIYADPWSGAGEVGSMIISDSSYGTMPDGRIVFTCARTAVTVAYRRAYIYDPIEPDPDLRWTIGSSTITTRNDAASSVLLDGRVLATGGFSGVTYHATSEIYDPTTDTWSAAATMAAGARYKHSSILLDTGQVFICCGRTSSTSGAYSTTCTTYNTGTSLFIAAAAPPAPVAREDHVAVKLGDGKVFIAGGRNESTVLDTAYIYDPIGDAWTAAATMPAAVAYGRGVVLSDGRVLVVGGSADLASPSSTVYAYDPTVDAWSTLAPMTKARCHHSVLTLLSGMVLVTGGQSTVGSVSSSGFSDLELYDPTTDTWTTQYLGHMSMGRSFHVSVQLPDDSVLIAGGGDFAMFGTYEQYKGSGT